jgi:5-methyltetrahydrofolate--homocysteine methyltransferase
VKSVYREQCDALIAGGVDFILVETIFDTLNAKAAIMAAREAERAGGPRSAADDLDDQSPTFVGPQPQRAHGRGFLARGEARAAGDDRAQLLVRRAAADAAHPDAAPGTADTLIMAYPNAGLPNELGAYDELPEQTAAFVRDWAEQGLVNILGGCCGSTPAHIAAIAKAGAGHRAPPHARLPRRHSASPASKP